MSLWQVFGLTGCLLARLPSLNGPVPMGRSFLFTAAGQFRVCTGFPFSLCAWGAKNHKVN
jgi:hypothetical protein